MPPLVKYSLIRIGLFAGVLVILMLAGVPGWLSAIAAALVALSVAYIFFRQQRDDAIAAVVKKPAASERSAATGPSTASAHGADEQAEDQ